MGSTPLTYGKKGRLRNALGSIRRGGSKAETDKKAEDSADSQKPVRKRTVLRKRSLAEPDTIDKLADELLDSSPPTRKSSTSIDPVSPGNAPSPRAIMAASTRRTKVQKPPARTPEPRPREGVSDKTSRAVTSRVDKRSSWTSPSASRVLPKSPKRRSESGLHRPLSSPQSAAVNPLSLHPTSEYNSTKGIFLQKSRSPRKLRKGDADELIKSAKAEPTEVNKKIHAMLAATNSLKSDQTDSAKTRMMSRSGRPNVLGKMSEAWGRLHSRSPEFGSRKQVTQTLDSVDDHPPCSPMNEDAAMTPRPQKIVSNGNIRINEGNNFNGHSRHKLQRMTGSTADGRSSDAKLSEGGRSKVGRKMLACPKQPSPISAYPDVRNRHSHVSSQGSLSILEDHFTAESSFEDNLERGILRASPIGSSTPPRVRVRRLSMSSSRYSTDQSPSFLITTGDRKGKVILKQSETCHDIQFGPKQSPASRSSLYTHASLDPTTELGQHFDAFCRERAKKHPSPSKEELEVLEVNLMKLSRMKPTSFPVMEPDELSAPAPSSNPLRPRDPNKLVMKQQPSARKRDSTGSIKSSHLKCSSPGSRLPQSIGSWSGRTAVEPFRIGHVDGADMTDELA